VSTLRGGTEESRERKIALFMTLVRAFETQTPITQEEIVANLTIDEFPVTSLVPKRKAAYEGNENAFRQKFERDKAAIRDLGFEITTTKNDYGVDAYCIDPASVYVPSIEFSDDELNLVSWATSLLGVGASGVARIFADGPIAGGGVEFSPVLQPLTRAISTHRTVRFRYRRDNDTVKEREIAPLEILLWQGQPYVIGVEVKSAEVKGFKVTRIDSTPSVGTDVVHANDSQRALARAWLPKSRANSDAVTVRFVTSASYARLIGTEFDIASVDALDDDTVEITAQFDSLEHARRAILSFSDHVRSLKPKLLRESVVAWLKGVNQSDGKLKGTPEFSSAASRPDVLGQTLQLISAVYQSTEPVRASQLAERTGIDGELIRSIMSRLMALQYVRDPTAYLVHIEPGDEFDDENPDDPTYARSASYDDALGATLAALTWRDAFELVVALKEAATLYPSELISRVISKIENTIQAHVRVMEVEPEYLSTIRDAIDRHEQLKIDYWSASRDDVSERWVEPRAMASRNGRWYFRAWCSTREAWLTFRVDRVLFIHAAGPAPEGRENDPVENWVERSPDEGYEVTLVISPEQRWLFEPLPTLQWATMRGDREIVRLRVRDDRFLDQLLVEAGPGCWVLDGADRDAGRNLAKRIISQL
jgi:proteasome accessory factor C